MVIGDDVQHIVRLLEDDPRANARGFFQLVLVVTVAVKTVKILLRFLHRDIGDGYNERQRAFCNI